MAAPMPPTTPPAGAPPAPPVAGPPPGPPPGGPEEAMNVDAQMAEAKMDIMLQARPVPKTPYSIAKVEKLASALSETIDKIAGTDIPIPEWSAPEGIKGKRLVDPETNDPLPLPNEIYLPVAALAEAIQVVNEDGSFDKYVFDPTGLVSDGELKVATGKLIMAGKDKKLSTALMSPAGVGPDEAEEEAPMDQELSPDEQELAERM